MTLLIVLAVAVWLFICVFVVALARMAARGDRRQPAECEPRFDREADRRPSFRHPG
jgi:hypothetical protein